LKRHESVMSNVMGSGFNGFAADEPERAEKEAHQPARTPRELQVNVIISGGTLSGSSGEGSQSPLANQLGLPSFCSSVSKGETVLGV
jgi:hypothetical protein